jgi:hypothetical protein
MRPRLQETAIRPVRIGRSVNRLAPAISVAILVLLVALTLSQALTGITSDIALWRDFGQDYLMGRAVVDGLDPYLPVRALAERYIEPTGFLARTTPAPHPPSMALLTLPLLALGYTNAVRAWFVLQVGALLVGVYLTLRGVGARLVPAAEAAPLLTLLLFLWTAVGLDVGLGQSTTLLLALLAGAVCAMTNQRPGLAGLLLGVSLLVKPLAWPWLVVLAVRRDWSAVVPALLLTAIGWTLPALRIGLGPVGVYFGSVLPAVSATYATEATNLSLWTIGPRLFAGTAVFGSRVPPLVDSSIAARIVGLAIPALILGLTVAWLVRARPALGPALGVMTGVALVINPISWAYYLVLMLLPIAMLIRALVQQRSPVASAVAIGCGMLLIPLDGQLVALAQAATSGGSLEPVPTLITLAPTLGVLGMCALLARSSMGAASQS